MARPQSRVENRPTEHASGSPSRKLATGLNLIAEAESRISAQARIGTAAFALGRTRAGQVATIMQGDPGAGASPIPGDLPLVQHTVLSPSTQSTAPIVLLSGTHQEAVDHTLLAHLVAERMACRVDSALPESTAQGLGLAALPEPSALDRARAALAGSLSPSESDPASNLLACFRAAAEGLGREPAPNVSTSVTGASVVIATAGWYSGIAREIAQRSQGRIAHLALRLLRPFPVTEAGELLAGAKVVLVAAPGESALHFEACCGLEEAVRGETTVRRVRLTPEADLAECLQAFVAAYPSDLWADLQDGDETADAVGRRVALVPSGQGAAGILLDVGARLADAFPGVLQADLQRCDSTLAVLGMGCEAASRPEPEIDVLAILDDRFAPAERAVRRVKEDGSVLIVGRTDSPADAWWRLSEKTREALDERRPRLLHLNLGEAEAEADGQTLAATLAELARSGSAAGATGFDPSGFSESGETIIVSGPAGQPRGDSEGVSAPEVLIEQVRRFHVTGRLPAGQELPNRDIPLRTVAASAAVAPFHESFPFFLPAAAEAEPEPLYGILQRWLAQGVEAPVMARLLPELARLVDDSARASAAGSPLDQAANQALTRLAVLADLSDAGRRGLLEEARSLRAHLSHAGRVVGFRSESWFQLYRWSIGKERHPRIQEFRTEATLLINRLEALLRADQGLRPESRSAAVMASGLGSTGSGLIDLERLSGVVPERRGPRRLSQERLQRIGGVLEVLRRFVEEPVQAGDLHVVAAPGLNLDDADAPVLRSDHPFEAARGVFDGLATRALEVVRALRMGRLEVDDEYVAEIHDEMVSDLTWEALSAEELPLIPTVLVLESGRRLSEATLAEFHRLIETGWPVHVGITVSESLVSGAELPRSLAGVLPDPGYLGLAQREAFVLQSSLARPDHLLEGFRQMCRVPGPAVCVLSFPEQEGSASWLWERCQSALLSRSTPLYVYDPWAGESWAERFSLEGNPSLSETLLVVGPEELGTQDASPPVEEALTFAHVLAQDPRFREQFWVIPSTAWSDGQKSAGDFLRDFAQPSLGVVPFIWVVDERGASQRAVVTREVLSACRDRVRSWRILQELAGVRNVYVERAVEQVREETRRQALAELEKIRLEARREGAEDAIGKLVEVLSNADSLSRELRTRPAAMEVAAVEDEPQPVQVARIEAVPGPEEAGEAEEEEEAFGEEAYIDSFLCTSCNECINLNPRMFSYNADRQALIADPSAGTYAELVKAAEACPARCIHPGAPQAGDATATAEVVERGKAFR